MPTLVYRTRRTHSEQWFDLRAPRVTGHSGRDSTYTTVYVKSVVQHGCPAPCDIDAMYCMVPHQGQSTLLCVTTEHTQKQLAWLNLFVSQRSNYACHCAGSVCQVVFLHYHGWPYRCCARCL